MSDPLLLLTYPSAPNSKSVLADSPLPSHSPTPGSHLTKSAPAPISSHPRDTDSSRTPCSASSGSWVPRPHGGWSLWSAGGGSPQTRPSRRSRSWTCGMACPGAASGRSQTWRTGRRRLWTCWWSGWCVSETEVSAGCWSARSSCPAQPEAVPLPRLSVLLGCASLGRGRNTFVEDLWSPFKVTQYR